MHNSYIRGGGVWAAFSVLGSAEMAAFDAAQYKSINGDDGGTWAPASIITLGGAGLAVQGAPFQLYDSIGSNLVVEFVDGAPYLAFGNPGAPGGIFIGLDVLVTYLQIDNGAEFRTLAGAVATDAGAWTHSGDHTISGGTWAFGAGMTGLSFAKACSFSATVDFTGNVNIGDAPGDALVIQSTVTAYSPVTFVDSIDIQHASTLKAAVTSSSAGRIVRRLQVATDANANVGANTTDRFYTPAGILSANRTFTVVNTGAQDGDEISFSTSEATHISIISANGGTLTVNLYATTGQLFSCTLLYYSGSWRVVAQSVTP